MTDSDSEDVVGDFKPGSIKSIKLSNFLTYEEAVITPGPRLNMVVGANGTGKSTILNAICLGLGGEPKLLGRADDARGFVMHGKDKASIAIELASIQGQQVDVIRREIDRNKGSEKGRGRAASTFYINDEKCTIKDVQELVSETYNISIDNLCTFLPQDKVGNFSGFDSKQLLVETEKTLKNGVYQSHMELISAEEELEEGSDDVDTIKAKLKKLQHENERLERAKDLVEEREKALEQADLLGKKRLWLQFEALRTQCIELKEQKAKLKQEVKAAQNDKKPLEDKVNQLAAQKKENDDKYKKLDQNTNGFQKEMEKQNKKYENHDEETETILLNLNELDSKRSNLEKERDKLQEKVIHMEESLAQGHDKDKVDAEYKEKIEHRKEVRSSYEKAKKEYMQCNRTIGQLTEQAKEVQRKLTKMNDDKARRRERIFRQQPELKKAHDWVEANRNKFRKPVIGPVCCEVTPKSQNTAAYLEQHVPNWALKAFVVQCKADYDLLYREVRQKGKIPINITNVEGKSLDQTRIYGESKMNILKKEHGVLGFLDESYTAPTPVAIALQINGMTHKTLIGGDKTQRSIDKKGLIEFLSEPDSSLGQQGAQPSSIFATEGPKSRKYTSTKSRYSGKIGFRVDEIMPARMLAPGVSAREKKEAEESLQSVHDEINKERPRLQTAKEETQRLEVELQEIGARCQAAKQILQDLMKLESKIKTYRSKLQAVEEDLHVDDNKEKKKLVKNLMNRVSHCISALEAHADQHEKVLQSMIDSAGLKINTHGLAAAERNARSALHDKEKEYEELVGRASQVQNDFISARKTLAVKKEEAETKAPLEDENNNPLPLKSKLEALGVDTLHEVEAALEEAESKANAIDANPDVIRQYEQRKMEIAATQEQLDSLTTKKDGIRSRIDQKMKTWQNSLSNSVSKINILFTKYMSEMGCTGEVGLVTGKWEGDENEARDFKNWGIEIRVSFRENTKAQVLSDRVQSGGERSVSTIMYLMALQDLMVAPFRCVDEINQGLDERNERLVFKRIVANATRPPRTELTDHSGQYWLITPKLLPNLTDMEVEGMTVLFVFNGPYNFGSPTEWDVEHLLSLSKSQQSKRAIGDAEQDDENSGNSVPRKAAKKSRRSK